LSYSAELPPIALRRVPPGYAVEEESYLMNEEALRTVYASIRTYREERDAWEKAFNDLKRSTDAYRDSMSKGLKDLEAQLDDERRAWKGAVQAARKPGVGIFAGVGYADSEFKFTVGVGFVWRLF
jgi:outer membrane protein TolC